MFRGPGTGYLERCLTNYKKLYGKAKRMVFWRPNKESAIDGLLSCFHSHLIQKVSFPLGVHPEGELLKHMVDLCLIFGESPSCFQ